MLFPDPDLQLSEETEMILETAKQIAAEHLAPRAEELDKTQTFPRESVDVLAENGFFGMLIPEDYEGLELDSLPYCLVIEELSKACPSTALVLSVHTSVSAEPILKFGTEEQRKQWLPKLAAGEILGAFCLTEPDFGSDAGSIQTKAVRDGDDWILDGTKAWVSNGSQAGLYLVIARTDNEKKHKGLTAFLVPRETEGLTVGKKEDKMGMRASDTVQIILEGVRVPDSARLGAEGEGFKIAMKALDGGRIGVASQALGIARAAFERAMAYAHERHAFGSKLFDLQAIQFKIADMSLKIEAARLLRNRAAKLKDAGKDFSAPAAMAKVAATEAAMAVSREAVQIHGGYGYVREYHVERQFRDAKITTIYEGTSEMQRTVIARHLSRGTAPE
jgi:alkylation response protein AidB-like acyl-CoA dehydrogenase